MAHFWGIYSKLIQPAPSLGSKAAAGVFDKQPTTPAEHQGKRSAGKENEYLYDAKIENGRCRSPSHTSWKRTVWLS